MVKENKGRIIEKVGFFLQIQYYENEKLKCKNVEEIPDCANYKGLPHLEEVRIKYGKNITSIAFPSRYNTKTGRPEIGDTYFKLIPGFSMNGVLVFKPDIETWKVLSNGTHKCIKKNVGIPSTKKEEAVQWLKAEEASEEIRRSWDKKE